ncbi:MAG: DNA topoisomerase 3 [Opitutales bacterium]|nr:DNA topoisomerase 3 [Opitutales bacterium]
MNKMKKLVIAEKPSVAADIARTLGKAKKHDDYYENDDFVISSALGHLIELPMPADIDKKYARWSLSNLPILPEKFTPKPIEKTKKKFQDLKKLMARKDLDGIINACDAGREGELIFTYIYEAAKCKLPRQRLWMSSMTPESIRQAFSALKSQGEMESLQDAARCRSESDWIVGINGTRAVTSRMFGARQKAVASVGRVQTPTLAMIVEREHEINNFTPKPYWKIVADFSIENGEYSGVYQRPDFKSKDKDKGDAADRIWDEAAAKKILEEAKAAGSAEVSEKKTQSKQIAPRLYDLTTLQREANNRFSFSAARTLSIAQSLYEKHKMLTYPRTDSRALPEDYRGVCERTMLELDGKYGLFGKKAVDSGYIKKATKRIFNNAQVSDHFAIIPTGVNSSKLSDDERKIYDMVARRFIAAFYPEAVFDVTSRTSVAAGHAFKTEGKVLKIQGWLEVYEKGEISAENGGENAQATLPALNAGEKAQVENAELKAEFTKPPARYTEATLLSAMEGAGKLLDDDELAEAMKEKGLGTPATRAQIIDTLVAHQFIERQRRELAPTNKAENLITFLKVAGIEDLTSPAMTGEWEYKLRLIEKNEMSRKEFMRGISEMATNIVERTKAFSEDDSEKKEIDIISPSDGKKMLETFRAYRSQDGRLIIYKTMGNRKMTQDEVAELLQNKIIGPLDGFKSKQGKPYSAFLKLDDEFKVKFQFGTADSENSDKPRGAKAEDLSGAAQVCKCPKCGGGMLLETTSQYVCSNSANKSDPCSFKIWRTMLSHAIKPEEVKSLVETGKTPLIEDFISKRTGKKFSAYLVLKDGCEIGFEFEKRAPKAKAAAKKAASKKSAKADEE